MKKQAVNENIRNIAIIAHVDHGKTTMVDALFRQSGMFRANQEVDDRLMDNMELERERGITIAAKNCSVSWNGKKINIIDTPGHSDFGGEVERSLSMVDGAILLVDAAEGPLPQTRFVLKKALEAGLKLIVVVNKIDRADARISEVLNEVYDLFIDLEANDAQLEFPILYAIGKQGIAKRSLEEKGDDLSPLFEAVINEIPAPIYDEEEPFQMLVSDLGYSDYLGRLAIGRIVSGEAKVKEQMLCMKENDKQLLLKVGKLQVYQGMQLQDVNTASAGEIVVLSGVEDVVIGDTICLARSPRILPRIHIDEPTVTMKFSINSSPLAGREGKIVQSGKIRERLQKESLRNVAIQIEDGEDRDSFLVKGRGEFQMAILIETMRREGFELSVGRPEVIFRRDKQGNLLEPIEQVYIDCEESFVGVVTEKLSLRRGRMQNMVNHGFGRARLQFEVPARGLIGYRDEFLTDTKGTGIMNTLFAGYDEYRGDFPTRFTGSIVCDRSGEAVAYALYNLEPRGRLFVTPGQPVYEGMIVGEHSRDNDIDVNACKTKKLTNLRASGKDENVILSPVLPMTLEQAIHFIRDDELVEITPQSIRLRKKELNAQKRHSIRVGSGKKSQ